MSFSTFLICLAFLPIFLLQELQECLKNPDALMEWFLSASLLIVAVLLLRWLLKDKVSCRVRYSLWAVVLVRLLLPIQFELPVAVSSAQLAPEPPAFLEIPAFTYKEPAAIPEQIPEDHPLSGSVPQDSAPDSIPGYNIHIVQVEDVILSIWWCGIAVVGLVLIFSNAWFDLRQIRHRKAFDVPDSPIPVYTMEGLPSPCLFGPFRPAVYLTPKDTADETKLRHILAHELTHYAHKDHIWAVLRCTCLAVHWFNPLVWAAVLLSKRDCELACDEGAVKRLGEAERIPYGRTLVNMVAPNGKTNLFSCSTTMTEGKKTIQQRIQRLVRHPETKKTALFLAVSLLAVVAVFTFAGDDPTSKELGIPTSNDAYESFAQRLNNDLTVTITKSDGQELVGSSDLDDDMSRQIKIILHETHSPLPTNAKPLEADALTDSLVSLHLDYEFQGDRYSDSYFIVPQDSSWYVCLEDWDWEEHRWFIPVATIPEEAVLALEELAPQSELERFFADLNNLFYVTMYDSAVDIDRYAFFLTVMEQAELDAVKQLLRDTCVALEDDTELPRKPTPDYILLDTDDSTSPAPEYMIRVIEDYGNVLYQTSDQHTPVATVPDEVITQLRTLADPDRNPRVVMGITILGTGNTQYELRDSVSTAQLSNLLLNDPETVAQNQHPCYNMEDWLSNWTTRCFVEYGIKIWNRDRTEGWYVRAIPENNSGFYCIDIPKHLVEDVLTICAQAEH